MAEAEAPKGTSQLAGQFEDLPPDSIIFGHTEGMRRLREDLLRFAEASVPVLVQGESGTGKEIIAKLLHARSNGGGGLFVKVRCPAMEGDLLANELFASENHIWTPDSFEADKPVQNGTLFLDEISELSNNLQGRLLQLLQDGLFLRVGGESEDRLNVRLVCASHRDLEAEVENGSFRRDLFYRINVARLDLLPLRERIIDVPDLVNYFIVLYNLKFNSQAGPLDPEMVRRLQEYHWPGNTRELENLIKRYVILGSTAAITSAITPSRPGVFGFPGVKVSGPISLRAVTKNAVRQLETKLILQVLEANDCNRKKTAKALNISYRALLYKIRDAGLPVSKNARKVEVAAEENTRDLKPAALSVGTKGGKSQDV